MAEHAFVALTSPLVCGRYGRVTRLDFARGERNALFGTGPTHTRGIAASCQECPGERTDRLAAPWWAIQFGRTETARCNEGGVSWVTKTSD